MLEQTFCHIPGVGPTTEKKLWQAGVQSWGDADLALTMLSATARSALPKVLEESLEALSDRPQYFTKVLSCRDSWRIFAPFRPQTAYLDIESTGLHEGAEITTIALYDGTNIMHYVRGHNLDDFPKDLRRYQVIVTYNGTGFDLPMIEKSFAIQIDQAHIDLRYVLASLGIKGGLKGCEKQLGINRGELDGVDGSFAITLWNSYKDDNNLDALRTLLAYNIEDTVNLELLMVKAHNLKVAETPFAQKMSLAEPELPSLPFTPDLDCIKMLRGF